jgi:hypothetical protein
MDTLASVIYGLFSQAYREHPAPPLMEKLRHFLRQSKPEQPLGPKAQSCLRESANCAMITQNSKEKREKPHG